MSRRKGNVFRFRPLESILEFDELEKNVIFFAHVESLNDPNEGSLNFRWNGDEILWTNFFKTYVYSLTLSWSQYLDAKRLGDEFLHETYVEAYKFKSDGLYSEVRKAAWQELESHRCTSNLVERLVSSGARVCSEEVQWYLKLFHGLAILIVLGKAEELGVIEARANKNIDSNAYSAITKALSRDELEEKSKMFDAYIDLNAVSRTEAVRDLLAPEFLKLASEMSEDELFLINWSPHNYFRKLDRLLFPESYVTCFARSYESSSMWGQYAGGHKGVCLEFLLKYSEYESVAPSIELESYLGKTDFSVLDVQYEGLKDVDFFANLPCSDEDDYQYWLNSETGKISHKAPLYEDRDKWNSMYLENYYDKILNKTEDWQHEQESRCILADRNGQFGKDADRALKYSPKSLVSITFGIKTPEKFKFSIIVKMRSDPKHQMGAVKLYQAYYCPEDKMIKRHLIPES